MNTLLNRIRSSHKLTQRVYDGIAYVIVFIMLMFVLFPLVWTALTSVKLESDIVTNEMVYIPKTITFEHYVTLWNRSGVTTMFRNSALTTTVTVLTCLLVGTFAAYSISRYRFKGRGAILTFYLLIRMFPVVLMLLPLYIMLRGLGLMDTIWGLGLT